MKMEWNSPGYPKMVASTHSLVMQPRDIKVQRTFQLSEIESLEIYNRSQTTFRRLINAIDWKASLFDELEASILRINLKSGGNWEYELPHSISSEFLDFINLLQSCIERGSGNDRPN